MTASNFVLLQAERPAAFDAAARAETLAHADPGVAWFDAREALEIVVHWLCKHDPALKLYYQDHLSAPIHEPTFRTAVGSAVFAKTRIIKDPANLAVHSHKPERLVGYRHLRNLGVYRNTWRSRYHAIGMTNSEKCPLRLVGSRPGIELDQQNLAPVP